MTDAQRFRIAPLTLTTFTRFLGMFPIVRVALLVPIFLFGLGAAGLGFSSLQMPWGVAALLVGASFFLPILTVFAFFWSRSGFVEINNSQLIVRGAPLGPSVSLDRLRLAEARAVDLRVDRLLWPRSGGGLNLLGYCAGTGTMGQGERVAWLLTDPSRVVYLPAREGHSVLVSVQEPGSLVTALRSQAIPTV